MSTKFKSTADAAAHLAGEPEVAKRVKSEIRRNELVSTLLQMRIDKGLTQEQIAERMGVNPSTVSRIESGNDRQLKWTDIVGYVAALKIQMGILFDDETLPAATRIKQCVFKIDEELKFLAEHAKQQGDEPAIVQGIDRFYRDVLFNFAIRFAENRNQLDSVMKVIKFPSPQKPKAEEKTPEGAACDTDEKIALAH
jgi:transcriptional regulator with XRE-family HTH domain